MKDIGHYLQAGTRENTRRSYQSAIEHFEVTWGGFLPATGDNILRYLVDHADTLSSSTLKQRLAALAQWHITQGFPDPTKTPTVRQVLKGIRTLHPAQTKQAAPLQLQHLEQAIQWLNREAERAQKSGDLASLLRSRRDAALLLVGFWRGFRSDELCRLKVEHIQAEAGAGMSLFLPQSKGDRENLGTTHYVPALKCLCPVQAYLDWISAAGIVRGAAFCRLDRWGHLGRDALHPGSLISLLRHILQRADIPSELYTSHSLRRGFATWATANGWDLKALMTYVGWKDIKSAMRYIDPTISFGGLAAKPTLELNAGANAAASVSLASACRG
ncbi:MULTISPECIES: site-specific integrase [Pseudomonas]|uniref:Site-specific integrase n=2 Tax=Pseudomonas TaxID=286 RepID=A0ABT5PEJ8_9PSED|nr:MULTISPECIES: site-specific integrase [Pseudomonas]MDD0977197.1 site-specific integrase [Pseudomonas fontis]MDD0992822.1 site-specific integrase [Pseudomonas fontis]MDD1016736.1 site-specific integrase [Pseudomonas rubra]MDD1041733.1 site-specific integrase [Pseudomonas rubra]MDD1157722.1 site-specific integrase [Pseudomonas rubra]